MPFVPGRDPKKSRREEKNMKTAQIDPVLHYLNFLTHAPTTIIPVAHISA
jgi:hypothetical protein